MISEVGLHQITTLTQAMQIPLVLFIVVLFHKAKKLLFMNELNWISLGFISNFIYLVCYILLDKNSPYQILTSISKNAIIIPIITIPIFSTFTSFCFFISVFKQFFERKRMFYLSLSIMIVVSLLIIIYNYFTNYSSNNDIFLPFGNIPVAVYNFISLMIMVFLFKMGDKKSAENIYLNLGFGLWGILQLLLFLPPTFINLQLVEIIGFVSSLFAKVLILTGISFLYVNKAKKSAMEIANVEIEKQHFSKSAVFFEDILRNTFHEITIPMNSLEKTLTNLSYHITKEGKFQYQIVENNYERIRAIISVAKGSYRKDALYSEEYNELISNNIIPSHPDLKFTRINTLIEYAIQSFRKTFSEVIFEHEYGGNCIIECIPVEVIQIFINLFKNAYEAPNENEYKVIAIKSYIERIISETNKKYVVVEIKDNAKGIPPDIIDLIWQRKFTTKKEDNINLVRGEGLYVVKNFITKYEECSIKVESPIKQNDNIAFGTKFTIRFKQYQISKN